MKKSKFPDDIHKYIRYLDGKLYWLDRPRSHFKRDRAKKRWEKNFVGNECGYFHNSGYRRVSITIDGVSRFCLTHRIVWKIVHGHWPKGQVDHIDHNRHNNKIENLRVVDAGVNSKNQSLSSTNTSGHYGVSWCKEQRKWRVRITNCGKVISIGRFKSKEDAILARKNAEKKYGFHENHGT